MTTKEECLLKVKSLNDALLEKHILPTAFFQPFLLSWKNQRIFATILHSIKFPAVFKSRAKTVGI